MSDFISSADWKPEIRMSPERKLIGMRATMSLANDATFELFSGFGPRSKEISKRVSKDTFCVRVYGRDAIDFTTETTFDKWAAVEVEDLETVPGGMDTLTIPSGVYAVFIHNGPASTFYQKSWMRFDRWLRDSEYEIDRRPHFEILGLGYQPQDPNAQEQIWVPVTTRAKK